MEKMGKDFLPFVVMVFVQFGFAGFNILSKLVMDGGMNPFVQSAYRPIFTTISIAPFSYFLERDRPKLTPSILFQIFWCSIFGLTGNQYAFFYALKNSTPTIATALDNLIPAFTFLLAVPVGLEKLRLKNISGQAKILGTMLCVGGAMLLSLYHGKVVIGQLGFHWKYAESTGKVVDSANGNLFSGPFLVIISSLTYALCLIIQTRVNEKYAAPYTCTALMCLMASIECLIIGFCVVHNTAEWALNPIRAISVLYNGIVCTSVIYYLSSWCIEKKGPLYVLMFNPLLLVISSFLSWILFREKLYIGTVGGSILTVVGLYVFIWGQKKEMELITKDVEKENHSSKVDLQLELQE